MATPPFMMGPAERARLAELRDRAARDPLDFEELAAKWDEPSYQSWHKQHIVTRRTVLVPVGFLVTFTVELNHPVGTLRRMIMSSPVMGLPPPELVWLAAEVLGFVGGLRKCEAFADPLSGATIVLVQRVEMTAAARERLH